MPYRLSKASKPEPRRPFPDTVRACLAVLERLEGRADFQPVSKTEEEKT